MINQFYKQVNFNDNNNNFSLIRNKEINRIGPNFIRPIFYESLKIHERMKELGGFKLYDCSVKLHCGNENPDALFEIVVS